MKYDFASPKPYFSRKADRPILSNSSSAASPRSTAATSTRPCPQPPRFKSSGWRKPSSSLLLA